MDCGRDEGAGVQRRASARRAVRCLPLLAAIIAGCGSSGPAGKHSVAGVDAAAQQFVANLQPGHYGDACKVFTATAQASMARAPGGCASALPRYYLLLAPDLNQWFTHVLPNIQVQGDTALFHHMVQARYEHGTWHLENAIW